jgi:hypothetical protein
MEVPTALWDEFILPRRFYLQANESSKNVPCVVPKLLGKVDLDTTPAEILLFDLGENTCDCD